MKCYLYFIVVKSRVPKFFFKYFINIWEVHGAAEVHRAACLSDTLGDFQRGKRGTTEFHGNVAYLQRMIYLLEMQDFITTLPACR